jgi:zinc D-Ala-D-Ala carboxypeptidase
MTMYRFFNDDETKGMVPDVCFKLDRAREYFGAPIVMTCGYRTPEHNAEIGGVPNSEHIYGRAADIRAPQDPFMRTKLAWALGAAGFRRIEIAKLHFHVDCSPVKTSPCCWEGDDHR